MSLLGFASSGSVKTFLDQPTPVWGTPETTVHLLNDQVTHSEALTDHIYITFDEESLHGSQTDNVQQIFSIFTL